MKEKYIENIQSHKQGEAVKSFFMIKSVGIRKSSNGKNYIDMILGDKTGEIGAKKWEVSPEDEAVLEVLKPGDLIHISANVNIWNNIYQLKLNTFRLSKSNDNLVLGDYILKVPEDSKEMYDYIVGVAESLEDEDLKKLCLMVLAKEKDRMMYYPAATKNHHALYGGLLYHIKRMLMSGDKLCQVYTNLDRSLVLAGVILHDREKLNEMAANELGIAEKYTFEGNLLGHLVMGVRTLEREMTDLGIPREKVVLMEHMVLSHHYEPEFGSPKRPMIPEAELLHYLDVLDAKMYDMENVLKSTQDGEFSEKVWTLNNRMVYKRKGE